MGIIQTMRNVMIRLRWMGFFLMLAGAAALYAQPDSLWSRSYGTGGVESAFAMVETADGGTALAGWQLPFAGTNYDFWLVRTAANGDSLWSRTYGSATQNDYCYALARTSDGGFALSGYTEAQALGPTDAWLIKTDVNGNEAWNHRYGGTGFDWCIALQQISDNGYILAGWTNPSETGIGNGWIARTNVSGDTLWTRSLGGTGEDRFYGVRQTTDGGFIAAGRTSSSGAGGFDVWLVRLDANGQTQWNRTYGGAGSDICYAMDVTSDGGFICAGSSASYGAGGDDIWLLRVNASGDSLWSRTFGGALADRAWSVDEEPDGSITLGGQTASSGSGGDDFWIIHTDNAGSLIWSRTLGGIGADICYEAVRTSDGNYRLAGQTGSYGAGYDDMWLVELQPLTAPQSLTIYVSGNDVRLRWRNDESLLYQVFSDTLAEGSFVTQVGVTSDTSLVIANGALAFSKRFYRVVGVSLP